MALPIHHRIKFSASRFTNTTRVRTQAMVAAMAVVFATGDISSAQSTVAQNAVQKSTDAIIRELIEKLGSDSYATRVRAREQLKTYGLEAFDALREAQDHPDSEVLAAAKYLISSLQVSWSSDSDPKEVREILQEYGAQQDTDRLGRIELLGQLPDQMGIEALARLSRFESSVPLSRRAAMLVLKQPVSSERAKRTSLADKIEEVVGENRRPSATWLLAYARDLRRGGFDADRWESIVAQQRALIDSGSADEVTSSSVIQLIRVLASRALDEGMRDAAIALAGDHIDLVAPVSRDLSEYSSWLIANDLFPVVVELYKRHQHTFRMNAELLYSAAQGYQASDDLETAERLASEALQINPLPKLADQDDDGEQELTDHQIEELARSHSQLAVLLTKRGQFDWAEREYLAIVNACEVESSIGVLVRQQLGLMYAEQLRHVDARDILFPLVDRLRKDDKFRARLVRSPLFDTGRLESDFEYEDALSMLETAPADPESEMRTTAWEKLQNAYRLNTDNIDILIKMHRIVLPKEYERKEQVSRLIAEKNRIYEKLIAAEERNLNIGSRADSERVLRSHYNQYAWLVSNTEGDYELALQRSKKSLETLGQDEDTYRAMYADTCARCYFSLGQIDDAIEMQAMALEIDPHSLTMQRQMAEFKTARLAQDQ